MGIVVGTVTTISRTNIGSSVTLDYGATTARVALPTGSRVRVRAPTACYIAFGDAAVEADNGDIAFDPGSEIFTIPTGATYLAALRVSSDGTLTVTAI